MPLIVVHGERDDYVPVEQAERVMAAAVEPKNLWVVRSGDPGQKPRVQPVDHEDRVRGFIERSCGWGA